MEEDKDVVPIRVAVRCRPLLLRELEHGSSNIVSCSPKDLQVQQHLAGRQVHKKYSFDQVYGHSSTQEDVYNGIAKPVVEEVLKGYNCTIFAYGQTSTGKTHTMEGSLKHGMMEEQTGIIYRAVEDIFRQLNENGSEFTVRVSVLELYNEELHDLLCADSSKRLRLFDDSRRGMTVHGLEDVPVRDTQDIWNLFLTASTKRIVGETQLNRVSSRSHVITTITIHIKEATPDGEDLVKTGKLNLVDLAGSENIGKSGSLDIRAKEAGMINTSLLTLGRVITSLTENAPHIPYRESKLTRLLQESLGGKAKTTIITTISPSSTCLDETLKSLDYANRAKNIKNRPEVNQKMTRKALIREMAAEIESLKQELVVTREKNGIFMTADKYQHMEGTIEVQKVRLQELEELIKARQVEFEELKVLFQEKDKLLNEEIEVHVISQENLKETKQQLSTTEDTLSHTKNELKDRNIILDEYVQTEERLYDQANNLLGELNNTLSDIDGLHSKISRKKNVESENKQHILSLQGRMCEMFDNITNNIDQYATKQISLHNTVDKTVDQFSKHQQEHFDDMTNKLDSISSMLSAGFKVLECKEDSFTEAAHCSLDQISSTFQEHDTNSASFVRDVMIMSCTAISHMMKSVTQQKEHLNNLVRESQKMLSTQVGVTTEFVHGQSNQIKLIEDATIENFDIIKKSMNSHSKEVGNFATHHRESCTVLRNELMEHIQGALGDFFGKLDTDLGRRVETIQRDTQEKVADIDIKAMNLERDTKKVLDAASAFSSTLLEDSDKNVAALSSNCDLQVSVLTKHEENASMFSETISEVVDRFEDSREKSCISFEKIVDDERNGRSICADQMKNTLKETESLHQGQMRTLCDVNEAARNTHESVLEETRSCLTNMATETSTRCKETEELVGEVSEELYTSLKDFREDISTGETPIKREVQLPSNLPHTQDWNAILETYREQENETVETPEDPSTILSETQVAVEVADSSKQGQQSVEKENITSYVQ